MPQISGLSASRSKTAVPRGYGKDSIEKQLWLVPNRLPTAVSDSSAAFDFSRLNSF
jgi:hypothetical protein